MDFVDLRNKTWVKAEYAINLQKENEALRQALQDKELELQAALSELEQSRELRTVAQGSAEWDGLSDEQKLQLCAELCQAARAEAASAHEAQQRAEEALNEQLEAHQAVLQQLQDSIAQKDQQIELLTAQGHAAGERITLLRQDVASELRAIAAAAASVGR